MTHNPAIADLDNAVGMPSHGVIVGRDQRRGARLAPAPDLGEDRDFRLRIDFGRRLVA